MFDTIQSQFSREIYFKNIVLDISIKRVYATDASEYREKPLPAYAVRLNHPSKTTVYVATELGTVQSFRNDKWRIFDFLWMLHTMDFKERDGINNWLLRVFSVLGLVTSFFKSFLERCAFNLPIVI